MKKWDLIKPETKLMIIQLTAGKTMKEIAATVGSSSSNVALKLSDARVKAGAASNEQLIYILVKEGSI